MGIDKKRSYILRTDIAYKIRTHIEESGVSKAVLARQIGVPPQHLSRICSGVKGFSLDRLVDYAAALGITIGLK